MFKLEEVKYKDILAIDELYIRAGEITCLVGESGSGKSTLLKLLNRMHTPSEGTIYFNEKLIAEWEPVELRREVVMLPQDPVLFGDTVEENLQAGARLTEKNLPSKEEMEQAIQQFYLDKNLEADATKLSGGEQQRLALARMSLLTPQVYLLDEPTSALDENLEKDVMERFVSHVKKEKKTMVFVTHNMQIAKEFSDTVVDISPFALNGGRENE
ncbi:ABC transporter ATP-binding protein [Salsuginibacillus kocurii]|uniref:ABC transporter ATP-binding protein n=1 Tax=Salsuginibacillus kocurii TaxID=427078 RepID=UPI0003742F42|nr:ATP-binding cassette domain-containing protein [Salsuginibacillus kocurii]